ncbi:hypothetical protein GQ85_06390 [Rhodococcus rhodochrous]|nr:hypothetical protein GQ85_06390 [Rhodococcus rhodochrous]
MSRNVIRSIFDDYEKKRAQADQDLHDKLLTPEGHRKFLDGWARQQKWSERIAEVKDAAEARLDRAQQKAAQMRSDFSKTPAGSTDEQLLFELRAQRQWARVKATLDTLDHVGAIGFAAKMIRDAEGHDAVALAQELGSYFEAKNYHAGGLAAEFDAKIPGLAEVNAEIEQANAEYQQVASAASAVRDYMEGKAGRHVVDICAPADPDTL